ncbi:54S ribosomal protein L12, mitochondrial, partial [Pseudocercospora fuligena]
RVSKEKLSQTRQALWPVLINRRCLPRSGCRRSFGRRTQRQHTIRGIDTLPLYKPFIMSLAPQFAVRRCAQCLRSSQANALRYAASTAPQRRQQRRWQSTEAAAAPSNPKIAGIVDQISQLTLLETADLVSTLKAMLGLSLIDSKKFVESAPKLMKEGVPKEEAEKIIETLKGLGAVVKME